MGTVDVRAVRRRLDARSVLNNNDGIHTQLGQLRDYASALVGEWETNCEIARNVPRVPDITAG